MVYRKEGIFMGQCPFWSTNKNKVTCFNECAFYSEKEECPFKACEGKLQFNLKDFIEFDNKMEENLEDIGW